MTMMVKCPNCQKKYEPMLAKDPDFTEKAKRWTVDRELIQNVWPEATLFEREQILTGICSDECWKEFLGPEE